MHLKKPLRTYSLETETVVSVSVNRPWKICRDKNSRYANKSAFFCQGLFYPIFNKDLCQFSIFLNFFAFFSIPLFFKRALFRLFYGRGLSALAADTPADRPMRHSGAYGLSSSPMRLKAHTWTKQSCFLTTQSIFLMMIAFFCLKNFPRIIFSIKNMIF